MRYILSIFSDINVYPFEVILHVRTKASSLVFAYVRYENV